MSGATTCLATAGAAASSSVAASSSSSAPSAPAATGKGALYKGSGAGGSSSSTAGGSKAAAAAKPKPPERGQDWDPFVFPSRQPSKLCLRRVQQDVAQICRDPPPGCFVFPDESESTVVHCLVVGPADTPYEGGIFYLYLACPDDYPNNPPRVKLMTGLGKCRLNPNMYQDGKVCLSILHTWSGPSWQPVLSITSVLLSIQSLLGDAPYYNEPGYDVEVRPGDVRAYNQVVQHETLRHAVVGMMRKCEEGKLPEQFREVMEDIFMSRFDRYEEVCKDNLRHDGEPFRDPFHTNSGSFEYSALLKRLRKVRRGIKKRSAPEKEGGGEGP